MAIARTNALRDRVASLRSHGETEKYIHGSIGFNVRMSDIEGAIGLSQRAAARYADLSNTAWARFERGEPMAPASQAAVEEVLGMPVTELPEAPDVPAATTRVVSDADLRWRVERLERAVTLLATQLRSTLESDDAREQLDGLIGTGEGDPPATTVAR